MNFTVMASFLVSVKPGRGAMKHYERAIKQMPDNIELRIEFAKFLGEVKIE